jgi:hypothetical protein
MDRNTEVTLDQVHDGIVATLQAQFPDLHVEAYRMDRKDLPVPACLVELTELEVVPELDPGTGQLAANATFEAQLVISFRQPGKNAKREIRNLAAAVAAFARLQRWGCPIGPAMVVGAYQDDFEPELDQYQVWRVEWQQVIHLGETVWKGGNPPPTEVNASFAPLIGEDYADEYQQVTP